MVKRCEISHANIKKSKALIYWFTEDENGRKNGVIPQGYKYGPIIRIIKPIVDKLPWDYKKGENGPWSLITENVKLVADRKTIANVWYLSEFAPDNLYQDTEFELYEGDKLVAMGIIL